MLLSRRSPVWGYLIAILGSALVIGLRAGGDNPLLGFFTSLAFLFAVLVSGLAGGWKPAMLTTLICFVNERYFYTNPRHSLSIPSSGDTMRILVYVASGIAISLLCEGLQRSWRRLEDRQRELEREMSERAAVAQERLYLVDQLQQTVDKLRRSNTDLEQFAYVASHDLQEPLRAVAGCVEVLKKRYQGQLDARADELIVHTVDGVSRMRTLIDDLLTYSRIGTRGKTLEPCDSNAILCKTLLDLDAAIADAGAVVTHDPLPVLKIDAGELVQLFHNLLSNAIKFRGQQPPRIHVAVRRDEGQSEFSVKDNGIGIQPEYFERIFVIFQRLHTRTEYPGTGIGLAICKKIVERHGGRIWLESEPGKGSTFYFTIPNSA